MYIYIYVYIHLSLSLSLRILKRLPPLPPTSGTPCMDAWMLGCLSLCCLVADLTPIWVAFWMPWITCGVIWDGPCKLVGACGLDWLSQGTQMSHLALLCRREHRFEEICGAPGPEGRALWRPVAPCCNRVDPL